ncbi:MAG: ATP-dependent RecD-like DNA helicase [Ruminococcus sp.]|nr:ATP-dependent RecD-like DNA helicase [Ruminococcus sp.]
MNETETTYISGEVDSIVFRSEKTGFVVAKLASGTELYTVVGLLGNIEAGEVLSCTGGFVEHSRFGKQFQVEKVERSLPSSPDSIKRYLSSGIIKGVNAVLAKKIVDAFAEETFDVIEKEPEKLTAVEGISHKTAQSINEEFKKTYAVRSLMVMLSGYDLPASVSVRSWKRWGESAEDLIRKNPYVLCKEGIDVSFTRADGIGYKLSIPRDAEARVCAGINYILRDFANQGHSAMPLEALKETACFQLGVSEECFKQNLDSLIEENELYPYEIGGETYIMLQDYYKAEDYIARRLSIMREVSYDNEMDYSANIDLVEEENEIEYNELQRQAINLALSKGFFVLTGGPGTGKTNTLNAMISLFEQQAMNVMLAAPTGRAAKRLAELTGHEAKTLHRLLEVKVNDFGQLAFVHNENEPLDCDVLVIDEMSMVDSCLFEAVLRAIKITCKLVLVGDFNQLPSVGAGNVLQDIISSGVMPVVTLTEIFRQAQESMIVVNAHKIVKGEHPDVQDRQHDFFFMERKDYDSLQKLVVDLCKERLPNAFGQNLYENIQVISPTRQGPVGIVELNRLLQKEINPEATGKKKIKTPVYDFCKGDKVMQNKNNYDILWKRDEGGKTEEGTGIFNGEIGVITAVNKVLRTVNVDFDGRIATYSGDILDNLELAYAITVHKSQGSEFDTVILTLFYGYDKLYYRNLLYTAVTRAKQNLIIISPQRRFYEMIDNDRRMQRFTCLKNMLLENIGDTGDTEQ